MRTKAGAHLKHLLLTMFASFPDPNCQEIGTKQMQQILRASPAVAMYAEKNPRVCEYFYTVFCAGKSPVAHITGASFCRWFSAQLDKASLLRWTSQPPFVLKVNMFFHIIKMIEKAIQKKFEVLPFILYREDPRLICAENLEDVTLFTEAANPTLLAKLHYPYIFLDLE